MLETVEALKKNALKLGVDSAILYLPSRQAAELEFNMRPVDCEAPASEEEREVKRMEAQLKKLEKHGVDTEFLEKALQEKKLEVEAEKDEAETEATKRNALAELGKAGMKLKDGEVELRQALDAGQGLMLAVTIRKKADGSRLVGELKAKGLVPQETNAAKLNACDGCKIIF